MSFKRMEGFVGSIPQKFIDDRVPKCPMCGTKNPHWSLDQKVGFVKLNRFLFKCEKCECILSASIADVSGMDRNPLSTVNSAKTLSGKNMSSIYMRIDDVGKMQATKIHEGKEIPLEKLNEMAEGI